MIKKAKILILGKIQKSMNLDLIPYGTFTYGMKFIWHVLIYLKDLGVGKL